MTIGLDGTALYGRFGGVEYALWNLLLALRDADDQNFYVVYIPRDGPPQKELLQTFGPRWKWVRLPFCGAQKMRRIAWQQWQLPRQALQDGCDLLHAPTYVCPLLCKIPVVLTVYDLIALENPEFATPANRLHYGLILKRCIQKAARVLVPSQKVQREVLQQVSGANVEVVPLGVEPIFLEEHTSQTLQEVRARLKLPEKFLLFVANPEPKKNLRGLLPALQLLPEAPPLVVIGGAKSWPDYEHFGAPNSRVISLGYVPREELPTLFKLCEMFVFPSLAEGFGLPVLEALACGAPVVVSREVPLPDLENVALLCNPRSPQLIAKQIKKLLNDETLREDLKRRGPIYAREFSWERAAARTLKLYQLTADKRR